MTSSSPLKLRTLGYWRAAPHDPEGLLGWPDPSQLVSPDWEAGRRGRLVEYLRAGATLAAYMGYSFCRFEDCRHPEHDRLGTRDLTDGRWVWPEGLWHYVADHRVRLPDAFVAEAAENNFAVPALPALDPRQVSFDQGWWLRWVAENTGPPEPSPDACRLEEAQALCAGLSTGRWRASASLEQGRWKLRWEMGGQAFEDFTGPSSRKELQAYLFRTRQPDNASVLEPSRAIAIAKEYERGDHAARPFAAQTTPDGRVWWALIYSGTNPPRKRLEELDFNSLQPPQFGWITATPDGWTLEVKAGMDEPAWRFYLEQWQARLQDDR
jgi:hypothetical protein